MAKTRPLTIQFPSGGVSKRFGYHKQAPYTTPSALNVWPTQWDTGRERGGVRPGLTSYGGQIGGVPYNWCGATWVNGGTTYTGVAVVHSGGVSVKTAGTSWSSRISTNPSTDFASCAVYLQKLFMARGGGTVLYNDLTSGASSGSVITPSAGTVPTNCGLVAAWGDRLVLAGDTATPHILYMSAIGDETDWDYSATDSSSAWANTGSSGGVVGEPITSLIAHNEDCLLVGCTDSIYAVRGNPRLSSRPVYSLSQQIGPLMQSAWCKTGNDFTFFMSRDGLYSMRPGCGEPPVSVSREVLPEDLTAIDPGSGDSVALAYDSRWRGIHIYVNKNSGTDVHYFYDMQSQGFWPMSFGVGTLVLGVNLKSAATETKSALVAFTSNGQGYQFDSNSTESIDSYLYYGPIAIGTPHSEGILSEISAVLSEDSSDVAWSVYAADSPQQAFALSSPSFEGQNWDVRGYNYTQNPLVRGSAMYLKLEDVNYSRWSVEEIVCTVRQAGRRRFG